jgi:hypothetical protein
MCYSLIKEQITMLIGEIEVIINICARQALPWRAI